MEGSGSDEGSGPGMGSPCPVCASPFTAYVRDVPTRRTKREIPLHTCLSCHSFWNPSGYVEDEEQLERDLEWGIGVAERNRTAARRLFELLAKRGIKPRSVAEIGCGIGTLLEVARELGMEVTGYDVNERAIAYARAERNLDVSTEMWTAQTETPPIDLYLCISVLEHVPEPRPLLEDLCKAAKAQGAALFVSVPLLDEDEWPFLLDPDPYAEGTPFFDNDVHVTHFSSQGLLTAIEGFGLEGAFPFAGGLWHGVAWNGA